MNQNGKFWLSAGLGLAIGAIFTAAVSATEDKKKQPTKPVGDFKDYYRLAVEALESGKLEKALALVQQSIELNSHHPNAYNLAAIILLQMKYPAGDIERLIEKALELDRPKGKNTAEYLNTLAEAYFLDENYDKAREISHHALEHLAQDNRYPSGQIHARLGRIHQQLLETGPALTHFEKALELEPDWSDLPIEIGKIYIQLENWKMAIKHFEIASRQIEQLDKTPESRPLYCWILENLAWLNMKLGNLEKAADYAKKGQLESPKLPGTSIVLAAISAVEGNFELFKSHLLNASRNISSYDPNYQHYIQRIALEPAFSENPYKEFSLNLLVQQQFITRYEYVDYQRFAKNQSSSSMSFQWRKLEKLIEENEIGSFCDQIKDLIRDKGEQYNSFIELATNIKATWNKNNIDEIGGILSNDTIRLELRKASYRSMGLLNEVKKTFEFLSNPDLR